MAEESELQAECLKYLKTIETCYANNLHGSAWCGKGTPDIIACIGGRYVAFELKVGKNDLQSDQRIRKKRILRAGGLHFTPRTFEEFKEIVDDLCQKYAN